MISLACAVIKAQRIFPPTGKLLNSQSLVYNGDRQAPPDLLNLLSEETDLDPDIWLMLHESMLAFLLCRNANASNIQPNMFP
jgi:hypothetical protein